MLIEKMNLCQDENIVKKYLKDNYIVALIRYKSDEAICTIDKNICKEVSKKRRDNIVRREVVAHVESILFKNSVLSKFEEHNTLDKCRAMGFEIEIFY